MDLERPKAAAIGRDFRIRDRLENASRPGDESRIGTVDRPGSLGGGAGEIGDHLVISDRDLDLDSKRAIAESIIFNDVLRLENAVR